MCFLIFLNFILGCIVGTIITSYMPDICQTVPDNYTPSTIKQNVHFFRWGYALENFNSIKVNMADNQS